jgi:hypothetical protein
MRPTNKVAIDEDQEYAPGCYILCRVFLDENGAEWWSTRDERTTILIQVDWDYPALASNLGWVPCNCGATDGTIDCAHRTAEEMIQEAEAFINEHLGEPFEDPGYFQ